ncbi:MAG TPA: VOC family protein [Myxococcota bacterium]|nr:VOC family protein [Myxococcota bacterium]
MPIAVAGFAHVNLNCRDLARSRRFYEQALGLAARVHTDPAPQDCRAFGLSEPAQWDAWMLAHAELGTPGCALDLLQWLRPEPLPRDGAEPGRLGLRALGFEVPDLVRARERIEAHGGRAAGAEAAEAFGCAAWDPEDSPLWLRTGRHARLAFVELGVSDLERSLRFYAEVLGLEAGSGPVSQPVQASGAGLREDGECRVAALGLRGDASGFRVALTRWQRPAPHGRAPRDAHRQGLYRMALLASDLDRRHAELRALGVADLSAPIWLDLGPSCPAPRCRALFFRDPDGTCLELIEVPSAPA